MKNESKGKIILENRKKLYFLSFLIAVVMAVSCIAIIATDDENAAATDRNATDFTELSAAISSSASGDSIAVTGDIIVTADLTLPENVSLTVQSEKTLTINSDVTFVNNGTITVEGTLVNNGTFTNNGTIAITGTATNNGTVTNTGTLPQATGTAPTAIENLVFNDDDQTLINAGSTAQGTMKYSLSLDGEFTTTLPEGYWASPYYVYYMIEGSGFYTDLPASAERKVPVEIAKADIIIGITLATGIPYGDTVSPSITGNTGSGAESFSYSGRGSTEYGPSATPPTAVGTYTVTATVAETANYNGDTESLDFAIVAAEDTVSVIMAGYTYAQVSTPPSPAVTRNTTGAVTLYYATVNTYTASNVAANATAWPATLTSTSIPAGTYYVYAVTAGDGNYNDGFAVSASSFTVAKGQVYVDITPVADLVYNGSPQQLIDSVVITPSGVANIKFRQGAAGDYTQDAEDVLGEYAGSYRVYWRITPTNDNYNSRTGYIEDIIIQKANISTAWDVAAISNQPYTGSAITPTLSVTFGSTPMVLTTNYTVEWSNNTEPGTATATLTPVQTENFTSTKTVNFTIVKADQNASADPVVLACGGSASVSVSGLLENPTMTYGVQSGGSATVNGSTGALTWVSAGETTVRASWGATDHYTAGYIDVTVTTTKAAFSATVSMESYTWGTQYVVPDVDVSPATASTRYYATVNDLSSISAVKATNPFTLSESVPAGTYYMYVVVENNPNMLDGFAVSASSFTVSKADPVYSAPTKKTDLVYTGSAQALANAGTSTTPGTFTYCATIDGLFVQEIPTGIAVGSSYAVYFKFTPDNPNYNSVNATLVADDIAIAKAPFNATVSMESFTHGASVNPNVSAPLANAYDLYYADVNSLSSISAIKSTNHFTDSQVVPVGTYYMYVIVEDDQNMLDGFAVSAESFVVSIEVYHGYLYPNYDGAMPVSVSEDFAKGTDYQLFDQAGLDDILDDTGWAVVHKVVTGYNTKADGTGTAYAIGAIIPKEVVAQLADADDKVKIYLVWGDAPAAAVTTAPAAISDLVYSSVNQALVSAGVATGGTMQYKLGDGAYGAAIPVAVAAGTYTVYYKAVGDEHHTDSAEASVQVTIAKFTPIVTIIEKDDGVCGSENNAVEPASVQLVGGEVYSGTVTYTYYTNAACTDGATTTAPKFAGTYYVKASVAAQGNYNEAVSAAVKLIVCHDLVAVEKKDNVAAHWDCNGCHKHFLDDKGTVEYVIPAAGESTVIDAQAATDPVDATKAKADATAAIAAVDAVKDADPNATIVAEINTTDSGVETVAVDAAQVKTLTEKGAEVKIANTVSSAQFSSTSLNSVDLTSGDFAFTAKTVAVPDKYKDKVGDGAIAVDLKLNVGTTAVKQFGDKVRITVAFTLPDGKDASKLKVYYVGGDELEEFECTYDATAHTATFETSHFSEFAVGFASGSPSEGSSNQGLLLAVLLVAAIVAPIIVALVVFRKY